MKMKTEEKLRTPNCIAYRQSLKNEGRDRFFGQLDLLKSSGVPTDVHGFVGFYKVSPQLYYSKLKRYGKSHL
ncbi:MAG: hypothetical protein PHE32_04125 [Candidatus Shapirobacteria bacterium]|nr:hypothetical protein [Candidatus Shapirobacteria bacterium]